MLKFEVGICLSILQAKIIYLYKISYLKIMFKIYYSSLIFDGGSMYTYEKFSHLDGWNEETVVTEKNLRISSIRITGALINNTAFHSSQLRGVMANNSFDTNIKKNTERAENKKLTVKKGT